LRSHHPHNRNESGRDVAIVFREMTAPAFHKFVSASRRQSQNSLSR
jgi:hypothetical protein